MLNSYCMVTKVPGSLRPKIFFKNFDVFCVSVVSEVGTRAPTPLEITQPQNITGIRLFSLWHTKSGLYFSLISSKYQIFDHSL